MDVIQISETRTLSFSYEIFTVAIEIEVNHPIESSDNDN